MPTTAATLRGTARGAAMMMMIAQLQATLRRQLSLASANHFDFRS
jgi:hypothetical protein